MPKSARLHGVARLARCLGVVEPLAGRQVRGYDYERSENESVTIFLLCSAAKGDQTYDVE